MLTKALHWIGSFVLFNEEALCTGAPATANERMEDGVRCWVEKHEANVFIVRHRACVVADEASAAVWYRQVSLGLRAALGAKKAYILVDLADVEIKTSAAKFYGPLAKSIMEEFALALVRFGKPHGLTKTAVLMESVIHNYHANVYADLTAALAVVDKLRTDALKSENSPLSLQKPTT